MTRTQSVLGVTLLAQCALLALVWPWTGRTGAGEPRALLPGLESATAGRIEIRGDEGKTLNLARTEGTWTLREADGFPAEASKVDGLLRDLAQIRVRRPVVTSGRYHEALKVTDSTAERRIRVFPEGKDDPIVDLLVGSSPNYGATNVRLEGDDDVFEVRDLKTYDIRPDPSAWIDRKLVDVTADDVTGIKIRSGSSTIELARADGSWTMVEPAGKADSSKVDTWLRGVVGILAAEPAGKADKPEYGFDEPAATVELTSAKDGSGATVTLRVGAPAPGEGQRYARKDGAGYAVTLSSWDAEKLTSKKPADFRS